MWTNEYVPNKNVLFDVCKRYCYLPCNFVAFGVVLKCDREISTFIKLPEACRWHGAWFESSSIWRARNLLKTWTCHQSRMITDQLQAVLYKVISLVTKVKNKIYAACKQIV